MDTKVESEIPKLGEDTSTDVTQASSEETEVKETTEESSDTPVEVAPRAITREVTNEDADRDPRLDDINRRSYETTRREIEIGFKEQGADFILDLDEATMSKERRSEVDAAIKHFWGNEGAKNLEQAKGIISKAKETTEEPILEDSKEDVNIDELIERKVEEKLKAKESGIERTKREALEKEQLEAFVNENDFLKPENDPENKNWKTFNSMFLKFDKAGEEFTFEEKLGMALNKSFGDEMDLSPSQNIGNVPITGNTTIPKTVKGLKDNKFLKFLPADTLKNLEKAGKL